MLGEGVATRFELLLERFERWCTVGAVQALLQVVEQRRVLPAQLADERERAPMDCARAQAPDRVLMLRRAVALVTLEAVLGIGARELVHEPVAVRLRHDRRGRDREVDTVAFVEAVLRNVDAWNAPSVDEHVLRAHRQCFDRAAHREQARVIDVDAVDLLDLGTADADAGRCDANRALGRLALLEIEALRVVDSAKLRVRRKHYRRGDHRAGHRSHADLVDAGDALHARAPEHALEIQHRVEPQRFGALALVALLERIVERPHAVARIALELVERLRAYGRVHPRIALADLFD